MFQKFFTFRIYELDNTFVTFQERNYRYIHALEMFQEFWIENKLLPRNFYFLQNVLSLVLFFQIEPFDMDYGENCKRRQYGAKVFTHID